MSDLKAGRRPHSGFLDLRRFKVPSAVVYALFILVIYSHAALARRQFTLRRSYLKVAGRVLPGSTDGLRDRADRVAGFPSAATATAAPDNGQRGKVGKETGDDAGEKEKEATEERPRVVGKRITRTARLFAFVYGLSARNIKSRGERRVPEVYSRRILYDP